MTAALDTYVELRLAVGRLELEALRDLVSCARGLAR
jgi:hypothetical protein